jgi:hypothetical protein
MISCAATRELALCGLNDAGALATCFGLVEQYERKHLIGDRGKVVNDLPRSHLPVAAPRLLHVDRGSRTLLGALVCGFGDEYRLLVDVCRRCGRGAGLGGGA